MMYIYPKNPGLSLESAGQTLDVSPTEVSTSVKATPVAQTVADRSDKVQVADAAHTLAAHGGDSCRSLTSARAAAIRGRVLSGAYDTLDVVDSVARRLLDCGDI